MRLTLLFLCLTLTAGEVAYHCPAGAVVWTGSGIYTCVGGDWQFRGQRATRWYKKWILKHWGKR